MGASFFRCWQMGVAFPVVLLASWVSFCLQSVVGSNAGGVDLVLNPEIEMQLSAAVLRVTAAAKAFDHLRNALAAESSPVLQSWQVGLTQNEVETLAGKDADSHLMNERFECFRHRGLDLLVATNCSGACGTEARKFHSLSADCGKILLDPDSRAVENLDASVANGGSSDSSVAVEVSDGWAESDEVGFSQRPPLTDDSSKEGSTKSKGKTKAGKGKAAAEAAPTTTTTTTTTTDDSTASRDGELLPSLEHGGDQDAQPNTSADVSVSDHIDEKLAADRFRSEDTRNESASTPSEIYSNESFDSDATAGVGIRAEADEQLSSSEDAAASRDTSTDARDTISNGDESARDTLVYSDASANVDSGTTQELHAEASILESGAKKGTETIPQPDTVVDIPELGDDSKEQTRPTGGSVADVTNQGEMTASEDNDTSGESCAGEGLNIRDSNCGMNVVTAADAMLNEESRVGVAVDVTEAIENDTAVPTARESETQPLDTDGASNLAKATPIGKPDIVVANTATVEMSEPRKSMSAEADVIHYIDGLKRLAGDLEDQMKRLRGGPLARLPQEVRHRLASAISGVATKPVASTSAPANRPAAGGLATEAAADIAKRLTQVNDIAKRLADPAPLSTVRRLGARLARLGKHSDQAEFDAISREVDEALTSAKRSKDVESGGGSTVPVTGFSVKRTAAEISGSGSVDDATGSCSVASVTEAATRFDKTLRGFKGKTKQMMLPPELENLHRVVHMLETLKNSLIRELGAEASSSLDADAAAMQANDCQRYFSGVRQLEADAAYYKGLNEEPGSKKEEKQQKTQRQESARPAKLEPLEPLTPPTLGARGQAAGRTALNARSF